MYWVKFDCGLLNRQCCIIIRNMTVTPKLLRYMVNPGEMPSWCISWYSKGILQKVNSNCTEYWNISFLTMRTDTHTIFLEIFFRKKHWNVVESYVSRLRVERTGEKANPPLWKTFNSNIASESWNILNFLLHVCSLIPFSIMI